MKCYQKNYPRPQFVRNQWESFNGIWDFSFDDDHIGESKKWYQHFPQSMSIEVPFTYESKRSGIADETQHSCVWYHRQIHIDGITLKSHNYIIHFEGSDYITQVWVNGQFTGTHTGGYARFSFDITHLVHDGINDITVCVKDFCSIEQMRGKQRWKNENYVVFYTQTTGIWKTVWAEYIPKTSISYVKMTPHIDTMQLEVETDIIRSHKHTHAPLLLEANVSFNGQPVNRVCTTVHLSDVRFCIDLRSPITDTEEFYLKLWSPEHPHLYDILFRLWDGDSLIDEAASYFAMREIRIDGQHI